MLHREEVPSKPIQLVCRKPDKEYFLVKIYLRRKKWLFVCCYNPSKTLVKDYLRCIGKEIDSLYQNMIIFVCQEILTLNTTEEAMLTFCQIHNIKNLISEPYML